MIMIDNFVVNIFSNRLPKGFCECMQIQIRTSLLTTIGHEFDDAPNRDD